MPCGVIIILITFYSPNCLCQETVKELFGFSSQAATCLPYTVEASHCPFIAERHTSKL